MSDQNITLTASVRTADQKPRALRRMGQIPAILYGPRFSSLPLRCNAFDLQRVLQAVGTTHLFTLEIDGTRETALIREVQRHPVTGAVLHVDFFRVLQDRPLTSAVPIVLTGHAPATEKGGILSHLLTEVEVECLPKDLPDEIVVDISSLRDYGDFITVGNVPFPPGVTVLTPPEAEIVRILAPRIHEEEAVEEEAKPFAEEKPARPSEERS
ncbi:MAG: 50S ribosomal protein L25 [Chloroflexi bacterium]|nr:50S ribosomal protein L25 [Chloroflexota bacterium]MBC7256773.1 50S ribosomal protein L25 [Chloroflexota bacterium]